KMKQHWRYLIARYSAYPVLWVVGGEVFDPPPEAFQRAEAHHALDLIKLFAEPGWTDVARYIRATDPFHHPLTCHEAIPPADWPVQDERLTDFDELQAGHMGWSSMALQVAQLGMHYARTTITKPIIVSETGGWGMHEEFDRMAFWLAML